MKIMLLGGAGAQGRVMVERLREVKEVSKIVCADASKDQLLLLPSQDDKILTRQVDANNTTDLRTAVEGMDLMVNLLPPEYNLDIMRMALDMKVNYQDLAAASGANNDFLKPFEEQMNIGKKFEDTLTNSFNSYWCHPGSQMSLQRQLLRSLTP